MKVQVNDEQGLEVGDLVIIHFENTPFSENTFIPPIGIVGQILNDAVRDTSYLVNTYWWSESNLEKILNISSK